MEISIWRTGKVKHQEYKTERMADDDRNDEHSGDWRPGNTLEKEIPKSPAQMLIAEIAVSKSRKQLNSTQFPFS